MFSLILFWTVGPGEVGAVKPLCLLELFFEVDFNSSDIWAVKVT